MPAMPSSESPLGCGFCKCLPSHRENVTYARWRGVSMMSSAASAPWSPMPPRANRREFSRQEPAEAGSRRILVTQDLNRASLGLFRRDQQRSRCGGLEERGHENRLTGGEGSVDVAVT